MEPAGDGQTVPGKKEGPVRRALLAFGKAGAAGPAACVYCYCGQQLERVRFARVRLPYAFVNMWWEVYFYGRRNR